MPPHLIRGSIVKFQALLGSARFAYRLHDPPLLKTFDRVSNRGGDSVFLSENRELYPRIFERVATFVERKRANEAVLDFRYLF